MSLADWLAAFRELHEQARADKLSPEDQAVYRQGREELARALVAAQRLALKPGETPRQALRVARALQVDLEWPGEKARALTLDLSVGGFAALLAKAPMPAARVRWVMTLSGGAEIAGTARVADVRSQPASVRVAFAFQELSEADRERLELAIFDAVLELLTR